MSQVWARNPDPSARQSGTGNDHGGAVVLDHLVRVGATDDGSHSIDEVGEPADDHGLLLGDSRPCSEGAHLLVEIGRVRLVGRQALAGDLQHGPAVEFATRPESGACQPYPLLGVASDLIGVGDSMDMPH